MNDDSAYLKWEARLEEEPDIDIDFLTLLLEARIAQPGPPTPSA